MRVRGCVGARRRVQWRVSRAYVSAQFVLGKFPC